MNNTDAMLEAIAVMRRSIPRDASDPLVGAVLVSGDEFFSQEHTTAGHAEYLLLTRLGVEVTAGAVLYTTLEPCTFRGVDPQGVPKTSCADLIVRKGEAQGMGWPYGDKPPSSLRVAIYPGPGIAVEAISRSS